MQPERIGTFTNRQAAGPEARSKMIADIRTQFPELQDVSDRVVGLYYGDLTEVAAARRKCYKCNSFANCWREEVEKGQVYKVQVNGERIHIVATACKPFREHSRQQAKDSLFEIAEHDRAYNFANYPLEQSEKHDQLFGYMQDFAETFQPGNTRKGTFMFGPSGIGKTHLMLAVANRLHDRDIPVIFIRADKLINRFRDAVGKDGEIDRLLEIFTTAPVLCIDEFGQELMVTDYSLEKMQFIVNERMRAGRPTFFTSNVLPIELYKSIYAKYSTIIDALRSRIYDHSIAAKMIGEDYRMNNLDNAFLPRE